MFPVNLVINRRLRFRDIMETKQEMTISNFKYQINK